MAPLRVETGRYEGLAFEERVCPYCKDLVEDESHMILYCPLYNNIRKCLFDYLRVLYNGINCFSDIELLKFILASTNPNVTKLCAKTYLEMLKCRREYVFSQPD